MAKMEFKRTLRGGFSRGVSLCERDGELIVLKTYESFLKRVFVDFSRTCLSLIALSPTLGFVRVSRRIENELRARKRLDEIGLPTSKIKEWSSSGGYLIEEFIDGKNIYELSKTPKDINRLSFKIGLLTGLAHSKGYTFIDNRPQNYILSNGSLYRVDLEMFKEGANGFDRFCDVVSFIKSLPEKEAAESFLRGYSRYSSYTENRLLGYLCKKYIDFLNSR